MNKRFVVLVEFSEFSQWLLKVAHSWAKQAEAELWVVHQSVSLAPGMGDSDIRSGIDRDSRREARKELEGMVAGLGLTGVRLRYHVTSSNPETALAQFRRSGPLDIIIVGIKGKSWFERLLLQDTAVKLIDAVDGIVAGFPMLPGTYDMDRFHIAVHSKFPLNDRALLNVLETCSLSSRKVKLVSVLGEEEDRAALKQHMQEICQRYADVAVMEPEILEGKVPFEVLREYVRAHQGILVVQKGSRRLVDLFRKYFVNDVIYSAEIPVVILP